VTPEVPANPTVLGFWDSVIPGNKTGRKGSPGYRCRAPLSHERCHHPPRRRKRPLRPAAAAPCASDLPSPRGNATAGAARGVPGVGSAGCSCRRAGRGLLPAAGGLGEAPGAVGETAAEPPRPGDGKVGGKFSGGKFSGGKFSSSPEPRHRSGTGVGSRPYLKLSPQVGRLVKPMFLQTSSPAPFPRAAAPPRFHLRRDGTAQPPGAGTRRPSTPKPARVTPRPERGSPPLLRQRIPPGPTR